MFLKNKAKKKRALFREARFDLSSDGADPLCGQVISVRCDLEHPFDAL